MRRVKRQTESRGSASKSNTANEPKVLLAARVSRTFHARVQSECIRREWSSQELITTAIDLFLEMPYEKYKFITIDTAHSMRTKLWSTYLEKMPEDKIEVMLNAMKWDLQMKKSARRKSAGKRVDLVT
jgi:hypothetical protein